MASKRECRDKMNSLGPRSVVEKKAKKKKWTGKGKRPVSPQVAIETKEISLRIFSPGERSILF